MPTSHRFGRFEVVPVERLLRADGVPAPLGARAFDLLLTLIEAGDRVVTKQELLEKVWPGLVVEEGNIAVQISALRKILGPGAVATIAGRGYRFAMPMQSPADAAAPSKNVEAAPAARPQTGNLPAVLPALFGRDDALATVTALARERRVVSLIGPGGIGKTRLGQSVAHALDAEFAGGAWLVELAPLADPALLPAAVAQTLGLTLPGRKEPQSEVVEALRGRAALIVLDNCEHVLEAAAAFVTSLGEGASRCHVVVTSQALLKVPDEQVHRIEALAVPAGPEEPAAADAGALRLFADRVKALRPGFELGDSNLADVIAICQRVDGLPLAIELAAARVPLLGVSGVRERLSDRFRILSGGSRSAMPRHQTLKAALDWSHGLLGPGEQAVFRRAGVFAGTFTMPAAQATLAGDGFDGWAVLDHLSALVDRSLVAADAGEPPRFRLLESAREYALEALAASGEEASVRGRHAAFYVAQAVALEPRITSAGRRPWLAELRADMNNFRAALGWLVRTKADAAPALRLVASLSWLAYFDGLFKEWRAWIAEALALPDPSADAAARAAALSGAARLASYSGSPSAAVDLATESVALWRRVGDRRGLAYALFHQGIACISSSRFEPARVALVEALACFRSLADPWGIGLGCSYLGTALALVPGAETEARALLHEGRAHFRSLHDDWGMTVSSHYLGTIALRTGDHAAARELTGEMLVNARELGDKYRIARNLHQLAEIDIAAGQPRAAVRQLHDSLVINCEQGRIGDAAQQLRLFTALAVSAGVPALAAQLAAVAERHGQAERTMPPDDLEGHARRVSELRGTLGEARYQDECAKASALSLAQAAALALALESPLQSPSEPQLSAAS